MAARFFTGFGPRVLNILLCISTSKTNIILTVSTYIYTFISTTYWNSESEILELLYVPCYRPGEDNSCLICKEPKSPRNVHGMSPDTTVNAGKAKFVHLVVDVLVSL